MSDWREHAACGTAMTEPWKLELFYPGQGESTGHAKAVCKGCPVREACLTEALETGEQHGIWGGCTVDERKRMHRSERRRGGRGVAMDLRGQR